MSDLLVIGSLAYDTLETPKGRVERALGGSANYFSLVASLYTKVAAIGVVGTDYGDLDRMLLSNRGVDLSGVQVAEGKTFHWEGTYLKNINEAETIKTELNVFESFNPQVPAHLTQVPFVFCANIHPTLQLQVIEQCKAPKFVGMDTMNFWIHSQLDELKKVFAKVNIILINEAEANQITGQKNAIAAAPKMLQWGAQAVVIKRGEYGFVLYTKESGFHILPAFPVEEVVDPTGAGDSFAGAFFGHLASLGRQPIDKDLRAAAVLGTVAASFTVQNFGVKELIELTPKKIADRFEQFKKVLDFSL